VPWDFKVAQASPEQRALNKVRVIASWQLMTCSCLALITRAHVLTTLNWTDMAAEGMKKHGLGIKRQLCPKDMFMKLC